MATAATLSVDLVAKTAAFESGMKRAGKAIDDTKKKGRGWALAFTGQFEALEKVGKVFIVIKAAMAAMEIASKAIKGNWEGIEETIKTIPVVGQAWQLGRAAREKFTDAGAREKKEREAAEKAVKAAQEGNKRRAEAMRIFEGETNRSVNAQRDSERAQHMLGLGDDDIAKLNAEIRNKMEDVNINLKEQLDKINQTGADAFTRGVMAKSLRENAAKEIEGLQKELDAGLLNQVQKRRQKELEDYTQAWKKWHDDEEQRQQDLFRDVEEKNKALADAVKDHNPLFDFQQTKMELEQLFQMGLITQKQLKTGMEDAFNNIPGADQQGGFFRFTDPAALTTGRRTREDKKVIVENAAELATKVQAQFDKNIKTGFLDAIRDPIFAATFTKAMRDAGIKP